MNLRLFLFPSIQFASHAKSTLTSLTFSTMGSRSSFFTTQITQKSTLSWKERNIITKSWKPTTNVSDFNKKILKLHINFLSVMISNNNVQIGPKYVGLKVLNMSFVMSIRRYLHMCLNQCDFQTSYIRSKAQGL